MKDTTQQFT